MFNTRFAPSPTGHLHLGHAYAALFAERRARDSGGRFLLRMEDIDVSRVRPEFYNDIREDLSWLGVAWDEEAPAQLNRLDRYDEALTKLKTLGVVYPCFCTRKDIANELAALTAAPHGPDGPLYPGTCRRLSEEQRAQRLVETPADQISWRLDTAAAHQLTGPITWNDRALGRQTAKPELLGDVVLSRKDIGTSYHIAVVVDDADQEINLVTRGEDLLPSTHIHRLLQALLDLPVPEWEHHKLITDDHGERLAKRNRSLSLRELKAKDVSAESIRHQLGFAV